MSPTMTPAVSRRDTERTCAVTGESGDRDSLLRFVLDPAGQVTFDVGKRLPGRGIWLIPRRDVLDTAIKRNAFARSAKSEALVPEDLAARVEKQIRQLLLDRLGLARRSGALVVGTEKTKDKLRHGKLRLLVLASDGSPKTLDPLIRIAEDVGTAVLRSESAQTLAQALGRATAVCSGVTDSRLAKTIRADHALLSTMVQPPTPAAVAAS
ncbi:MAG: DUF448 domain-containing protein [Alphaproteobacteria bacterium TMED89]|nr:hypothetical protein [Rhodospirillaceae bacterium]RPH15031.1 MAG: DUF448 domain-containing protein [Alphaproteobacteria bacterium TMED89]